jgi:hypothetical protein
MVGKYLFFMQNNLDGVIDVGADPGLDEALLGEGWGVRAACGGDAVCRPVQGRARLFAPLDAPEPLRVAVRAAGTGRLRITVNGTAVAEGALQDGLAEVTAQVPRARWRAGLNEVGLETTPGGVAQVDRVVFLRPEPGP